jgi:hypothetical protein
VSKFALFTKPAIMTQEQLEQKANELIDIFRPYAYGDEDYEVSITDNAVEIAIKHLELQAEFINELGKALLGLLNFNYPLDQILQLKQFLEQKLKSKR